MGATVGAPMWAAAASRVSATGRDFRSETRTMGQARYYARGL
jgi:hypothetical protein